MNKLLEKAEEVKSAYEEINSMLDTYRSGHRIACIWFEETSKYLDSFKADKFNFQSVISYDSFVVLHTMLGRLSMSIELQQDTFQKLQNTLNYLKYRKVYMRLYELYSDSLKYYDDEMLKVMQNFVDDFLRLHPEGRRFYPKSWADELEKTKFYYVQFFYKKINEGKIRRVA